MLLILFKWLSALGFKIPMVFSYFSTRMILASITCLLFTILLGPSFIKKLYELKIGQTIRNAQECPLLAELHEKKKDTPTMGGILILASMLVSLLLWMDLTNVFTWLLILCTVVLGLVGAVDDYYKLRYKNSKGIKPRKKLLFQVLFSTFISLYLLMPSFQNFVEKTTSLKPPVAKTFHEKKAVNLSTVEYASLLYAPFVKQPFVQFKGIFLFLLLLVMIFIITGTSNAVNLTDGLDGLAAGCVIMVAVTLAIFAFFSNHMELSRYLNILYIEGSGEIAVYLLALAGATLGFLWFNGYPAQVFMGDTGSLGLGGILGLSAILIKRELILALAGMIFVVETLSVILQVLSYKFRNKKRIFLCAPLHHHFEYKGWPETKVVLRFWIISLLFSIIAIGSLKFQ